MKSGFTSGDFHRAVVRALPVLMFATALLCIACGSSGSRAVTGLTAATPPAAANDDAAEEVLAAPVPAGVDPQLWSDLTAELARCLRARSIASVPPATDFEAEFYVSISIDGVHWRGPMLPGDFNRDGVVNAADITPLAVNYGRSLDDYNEVRDKGHIDYNRDGVINVADITALARNWGRRGSTYLVEWSLSPDEGFTPAAEVAYSDCTGIGLDYQRKLWLEYSTPLDGRGHRRFYARVTRLQAVGSTTTSESRTVAFSDPHRPPAMPVTDLAGVEGVVHTFTWSTRDVIPDGNQNGITEIYDLDAIHDYCGQSWNDSGFSCNPAAAVADYDRDGTVSVGDMTPIAVSWGCYITHFVVSIATLDALGVFTDVGSVDYFTGCAGFNEYGFRYYEFTIPSLPEPPYWVTVRPYADDMPGVACTPLLVAALPEST